MITSLLRRLLTSRLCIVSKLALTDVQNMQSTARLPSVDHYYRSQQSLKIAKSPSKDTPPSLARPVAFKQAKTQKPAGRSSDMGHT